MKLSIARTVMRVVGTLAGLLGVGMLCIMSFVLYQSITERNPWMIVLAIFPLALALYFIYVAYLVWFRFSPLAVRHICGALGFYVLMLLAESFEPALDSNTAWSALAFFGCLVVVYFAYRIASARLSRWLFPGGISAELSR